MMRYLPTGDFGWGCRREVEKFRSCEWVDEDETGCIVKCDIEMPVELHEEMKS